MDTAPANGPVVILSNSLCAPYNSWDYVVAALNKRGFRTLRYDQPGHGDSSATRPVNSNTFNTMAEDVYFLLGKLGLSSVYAWIGVSMGASTGIYFVTKYPGLVSKIAICDTISCSAINAGIADPFGPRVVAVREARHMEDIIEATLDRWFGQKWLSDNTEEAMRIRRLMLRTSVDGFEACCAALMSRTFDLRPLFGRVGECVDDAICIVGEKDANLPETMSQMRDEIQAGFSRRGLEKTIKLMVIPNAGHVCFIDGFMDFILIILGFL